MSFAMFVESKGVGEDIVRERERESGKGGQWRRC